VILGAAVLEIYNGIVGFVPDWLRTGSEIVRFLIQLVAWFGLMLAVAGSLALRVVRKDEINHLLIGFGAIIFTLELLSSIPFRFV
jgi:hypothetical protein